ncbi:hypothetical protein GCM10027188_11630 [Lysobacter humi (ex Lee et al. 2017)]
MVGILINPTEPANAGSVISGARWRACNRPHNPRMDIHSDNPEHGFQFPGEFELCAMGLASADLPSVLPRRLAEAGVQVLHGGVSWKPSSNGKYVSVRIPFLAPDRDAHDRAHALLREHPDVKWTL